MGKMSSAKRPLLNCAYLVLLAAGSSAFAQQANAAQSIAARARTYSIPPQPLGAALNQFALQSDRELLFSTDVVAGKLSEGIRGKVSDTTALTSILKGTGLSYRQAPSGAFLIQGEARALATAANLQSGPAVSAISESAPPSRPADDTAPQNDDIVVTASLRREKMRDVPSSITALGSQQLRNLQATRFDDFISQVPNISFAGTRGAIARSY